MSEQDDTAEIIEELFKIPCSLTADQIKIIERVAERLKQLHARLTAIESANAKQSAINESYYQQVIKETRDHGND